MFFFRIFQFAYAPLKNFEHQPPLVSMCIYIYMYAFLYVFVFTCMYAHFMYALLILTPYMCTIRTYLFIYFLIVHSTSKKSLFFQKAIHAQIAFQRHLTAGKEAISCLLTACFNPLNASSLCCNCTQCTQLHGGLQYSPIHLGVYFKGALTGKRLRNRHRGTNPSNFLL